MPALFSVAGGVLSRGVPPVHQRVLLVWASYWHPKPREDLMPNLLGEWAFDDDVVDRLEGLVA